MVTTNDTGGWKIILVPESEPERRTLDRAMSELAPAREDHAPVQATVNVQMPNSFSRGGVKIGVTLLKARPATPLKLGSRLKEVAMSRDFKMDAANDKEDK